MADFEVHPVGTKKLLQELQAELTQLLAVIDAPDFTDEEKSDMYWQSNTSDDIAPDEDTPIFLKKQAD